MGPAEHENTTVVNVVNTLESRVQQSSGLEAIRKDQLRRGDWILVTTRNSVYSICVLSEDEYLVSGGWFDRQGSSPAKTTISGCTWGGSALKHDVVAACGLFLEFGNRVTTTRIREIRLIRGGGEPDANALVQ